MYNIEYAYARSKAYNGYWQEVDVANVPMFELYETYRKVYLTLSSAYLAEPIHVDFEIFRTLYSTSTDTLQEVLNSIGNETLETIPAIPQYESQTVKFSDAYYSGYNINKREPGSPHSIVVNDDAATELVMSRPETDMQQFYDYCMVTVNGYFHPIDTDGVNIYVPNAGKTLYRRRSNQVGIMSFEKIGKIKQIPITEDMIYKKESASFLKHKASFDLGTDISGKTVLAVIGGYLYLPEPGVFFRTNDRSVTIDFTHVPVIERFLEARECLDMSGIAVDYDEYDDSSLIKVDEFFSDDVFVKYLTHYTSYFVVVDTEFIYSTRHVVKKSGLNSIYIEYDTEPVLPLFTGVGRVCEYWKKYEYKHWWMYVQDDFLKHRLATSVSDGVLNYFNSSKTPYRRFSRSIGYLLEIGCDVEI